MKSKQFSRILALLLAITLMPLGVLSFSAQAAETETVTVYVNGQTGSDAADGTTAANAVKTIQKAYDLVLARMESAGKATDASASARIVLTGDTDILTYSVSSTNNSKKIVSISSNHVFRVIFSGQTGAEKISFLGYTTAQGAASPSKYTSQMWFTMVGPTTFENLVFYNPRQYATLHAALEGALIIGENVSLAADSPYRYSLVASPKIPVNGAPSGLIVHSGTWGNLYAANYNGNLSSGTAPTTGAGYLYMDGGTATKVGATYNTNNLAIPCEIHLKNVTIANLYAATIATSTMTYAGDLTLDLENVTVTGDYKLNAHASSKISGDLYLSLSGVTANNQLDTSSVQGTVHSYSSVAAGETKTISAAGTTSFERFSGGGTLILGQQTTLKVTGSVTGSTSFSVSGGPLNRIYIEAPAATPDNAFVYTGEGEALISVNGTVKTWSFFDEAQATGLVLTAPEAVTLNLYSGFLRTGFDPANAITPEYVKTVNGVKSYYFTTLTAGNYCYTADGTGYYSLVKNLYLTAAKLSVRTAVDANPGLKAGNGYEDTARIMIVTDEMIENVVKTDETTWAKYADVLQTPAFTLPKAANEYTSQSDLLTFLAGLDALGVSHAKQYVLSTSGMYGFDLPIIVFTTSDLSGASTWQEAASIVKNNGKITVHYQAQIHGNEPAGGEGALAVLGQLYKNNAWREGLLENINLYVIPRVNPDGSYAFTRNNVAQGINMNRDLFTAASPEIQAVLSAVRAFDPYVKIDGHEYTVNNATLSGAYNDILMRTSGNINLSQDMLELGWDFMKDAFDTLALDGLTGSGYPDVDSRGGGATVNDENIVTGTAYQGLDGPLSFLVETRGIYDGRATFRRRVVSQYVTIKSLLDQASAKAATVRQKVEAERADLIEKGKTFDPSRLLSLKTKHVNSAATAKFYDIPKFNYATGAKISDGLNTQLNVFDTVERSRVYPTAYLIPMGESFEAKLLQLAALHGIEYDTLPAGKMVSLRQYGGSKTEATLSDEKYVVFPNGAYVFPMDQKASLILAYLMEPDVDDAVEGTATLVQQNVVTSSAGLFPIYRYEHDLEADGSVASREAAEAPEGYTVNPPATQTDTGSITGLSSEKNYEYRHESSASFTSLPAGSTSITGLQPGYVYLRFAADETGVPGLEARVEMRPVTITEFTVYLDPASGSDSGTGYTAALAVSTIERATDQLDLLMHFAPEGQSGTIVLLSDWTFSGSGTTPVDLPLHSYPLILRGNTPTVRLSASLNINMGGPTTIENLTVHQATNSNIFRFLCGAGYRFVIGENVTGSTAQTAGDAYYGLVGGAYNAACESTDLVVTSGTWRSVYAGTYVSGSVQGDAHLTITGGTIRAYAQVSYNRSVGGNVYISISNAAVLGNATGENHYLGVSSATVNGDLYVTLGEGADVGKVYMGSRTAGGALYGTAHLILDGAVLNTAVNAGGAVADCLVSASEVSLRSGSVGTAAVFTGFDSISIDTSAGGTLALASSLTVSSVTGGGAVTLPFGETLTATGSVTGRTALQVTGATSAESTLAAAPEGTSSNAFSVTGAPYGTKKENGQILWILNAPLPAAEEVRVDARTVIFQSKLETRYLLKKDVFDSYLSAGMTVQSFTVKVGDGAPIDLTASIGGDVYTDQNGNEYYYALLSGISPKNADTPIVFDLVCDLNGTPITDHFEDSVLAALQTVAASSSDPAFRLAARATLLYCQKAADQFIPEENKDYLHFTYQGEAFTVESVANADPGAENTAYYGGDTALPVRVQATSLVLQDEISLKFWADVRGTAYAGLAAIPDSVTVKVYLDGVYRADLVPERSINSGSAGYWTFRLRLPIRRTTARVTVELYENGEAISNSFTDSVWNYAVACFNESYKMKESDKEIARAILNYIHYVTAYLDTL